MPRRPLAMRSSSRIRLFPALVGSAAGVAFFVFLAGGLPGVPPVPALRFGPFTRSLALAASFTVLGLALAVPFSFSLALGSLPALRWPTYFTRWGGWKTLASRYAVGQQA